MNVLTTRGAAVMIALAAASAAPATAAPAQLTKTIPGETKVVTATVESIERGSREVTVKKSDGKYETFYVSPEIKRFDTLKVGDRVSARYYETLVLQLKAAGDKAVDTTSAATTRTEGKPSGTAAAQQTITATITEIDPKVPSITFSGPRGWTYSSRVEDKNALSKVKVGDRVDITWTSAMLVSLDPAK
jgi:Cu/Ag efflux protein CusF